MNQIKMLWRINMKVWTVYKELLTANFETQNVQSPEI